MAKPEFAVHGSGPTPQGLYDRVADVQRLAMKLNGYRASVAKYLRALKLQIGPNSMVLDAGCGTGIVTLALQDAYHLKHSIAVDLSFKSLEIAREQFRKRSVRARTADPVQGNVLDLPFADDSFELVVMCGVLEYTPLDAGLREAGFVYLPWPHGRGQNRAFQGSGRSTV